MSSDATDLINQIADLVSRAMASTTAKMPTFPPFEEQTVPGVMFSHIEVVVSDINRTSELRAEITVQLLMGRAVRRLRFDQNSQPAVKSLEEQMEVLRELKGALSSRLEVLRANLDSVRSIQSNMIQMEKANIVMFRGRPEDSDVPTSTSDGVFEGANRS